MEGGSKTQINLSAGIDVHSSDMIVPVSSPTFQHNWQRWQGHCLPNSLRFEKNGWAAGWNVYQFNYNSASEVEITSTDVRNPDVTKTIGKINPAESFQFIKQHWNSTVEVENFWWIDSIHTLELNMYNFVLKRKTDRLDDWNGDVWETIWEKKRADYLPSDVDKWFCTCAYNDATARLVVLKQISSSIIRVIIYDPLDNMASFSVSVAFSKVSLGSKLNGDTSVCNSYAPITTDFVLCHGEFSSTVVSNRLLLGVHANNNMQQWCIIINLDTKSIERIIQGYGYVGLKGELTGNEIPDEYFDVSYGFTGTVQPLSSLSTLFPETQYTNNIDSNTLNITGKKVIIGTEDMCWYIQNKLYGIVSHLTYNGNGTFTKAVIPMTNNYSAVYKSPSATTTSYGDLRLQKQNIFDLLNEEAVSDSDATGLIRTLKGWLTGGLPSIFFFNPKVLLLTYLQQTLGQYAYVHYNSHIELPTHLPEDAPSFAEQAIKPTDTVQRAIFDEHQAFNKVQVKQHSKSTTDNLPWLAKLAFVLLENVQLAVNNVSINKEHNTTATSDIGKKFSQFSLDNAVDSLMQSMLHQGIDKGISITTNGLLSLDMFYSNSDKQQIYAGPGHVEHRFVADCMAQSVTAVHVEGILLQLYLAIPQLGELQAKSYVRGLDKLIEWTEKQADVASREYHNQHQTIYNLEDGTGVLEETYEETNQGSVSEANSILTGIADLVEATLGQLKAAIEVLQEINSMFAQRSPHSFVSNRLSNHNLSVEPQHRYGEKAETFMWPCFGVPSGGLTYTDEAVAADVKETDWQLYMPVGKNPKKLIQNSIGNSGFSISTGGDATVPFDTAMCYGTQTKRTLPANMAKIEGVQSFLMTEKFKNENIGVSTPAFAPSFAQDYMIDEGWKLGMYCTYVSGAQWISCDDTKLIDGPYSNIVLSDMFCGIASSYTAIEVKKGFSKEYNRPWAITPNVLAFNCNRYNSIFDDKLYHAFDGYSYRLVDWVGEPGFGPGNAFRNHYYAFQVNDRFKRSNKLPANEVLGHFKSEPVMAVSSIDDVWTEVQNTAEGKGLVAGTIGEDRDQIRWAIPIFTEQVSTLPAAIKTLTAAPLGVVEGVTSLCVELMNTQTAYKAPLSVDFTIGKQVYRFTEEYVCSVQTTNGIDVLTDIVPTLGLTFVGATPTEAYLYSKATRHYYVFSGGSTLVKMDMLERFRDVQKGYWDFVNQEVVMPCLMTYSRLNKFIVDTDTETDNILVPVLSKAQVSGELPRPITTIFNDRSWYKCVSLPSGFAFQGPNRVIINRSVFVEYMLDNVKKNFGKWKRVPREQYNPVRRYKDTYDYVTTDVNAEVEGWTHNQFLLVTSALGVSEQTDCMFEWEITFCWPIEMDLLYGPNNYACVNIASETMTPGGKVLSRPTHVFLTKELFTRKEASGYYNFRYTNKCGAGNRERLHIWSDAYIAISSLQLEYKMITQKRTEQLTIQPDVQDLKEL